MPENANKSTGPMTQIVENLLRARELRQLESARDDGGPVLWMLLGLVLMACYFLALTTHWFSR
jgi:hypothetical protein